MCWLIVLSLHTHLEEICHRWLSCVKKSKQTNNEVRKQVKERLVDPTLSWSNLVGRRAQQFVKVSRFCVYTRMNKEEIKKKKKWAKRWEQLDEILGGNKNFRKAWAVELHQNKNKKVTTGCFSELWLQKKKAIWIQTYEEGGGRFRT